jgi:hypothetical protein
MGNFGEFAKLVQRPNMVQPEPYTMVDVVGAGGVLGTRAARNDNELLTATEQYTARTVHVEPNGGAIRKALRQRRSTDREVR